MPIFVMLTRLSPQAATDARALEELERGVAEKIASKCPEVRWKSNYALLGRHDYLDIFEAPDIETASKVAALTRTGGHAHTEIWPAVPWDDFKSMIRAL